MIEQIPWQEVVAANMASRGALACGHIRVGRLSSVVHVEVLLGCHLAPLAKIFFVLFLFLIDAFAAEFLFIFWVKNLDWGRLEGPSGTTLIYMIDWSGIEVIVVCL